MSGDYWAGLLTFPAIAGLGLAVWLLRRSSAWLLERLLVVPVTRGVSAQPIYRARAAALFATTPRALLIQITRSSAVAILAGQPDHDAQQHLETELRRAVDPRPAPTLRLRKQAASEDTDA